jgi:Arc/MetJ family transcription regulator
MRTNIDINDDLLEASLEATGLKTKKAVVELGLHTLLRLHRQSKVKQWRGKLRWEGNLDKLRLDK